MLRTELEPLEKVKIAFATSLMNANAGMRWLDHDSMDEMVEAAWAGFEQPAKEAIEALLIRIEDLELVADLALGWLGEQEPPDSRTVSNEFVAMAAIRCKQADLVECREIVRNAIEQSQ